MANRFVPVWLVIVSLFVLLVSCRPAPAVATPTPEPDMILTAAASTVEVRLTELARPADTKTPPPTNTPAPVTPTRSPTLTPTLFLLPTITPTGGTPGGDQAAFVADLTIPDGTDLSPGERFTKSWRLSNTGTSVWTSNYALAFLGGSQMDGPNAVSLTQTVNPGESVDISVNLVAPLETGNYKGFWGMRNAGGQQFPNQVYVEIDVVGGTPSAQNTAPPPGDARVTDADLSVDDPAPEDCPHTFNFTASFTLSEPASVEYQLEADTGTPGFEFSLPDPVTSQFAAGNHSVLYNLDISSSVDATAQFHILSPNDVHSNEVSFSLTCNP